MRIDLVLATRNRADSLRRTLESLAELEACPGGLAVFVADNGSTDETPIVLRSFVGRLPLTVVNEPRPGKNQALNAVLPLLQGDLVLFTDDDVTVEPDLLRRHEAAALAHPEYAIFGGAIEPDWALPPPSWLLAPHTPWHVMFAATDIPGEPARREGPCAPDRVYGPNMIVRRQVFVDGFAFDDSVGQDDAADQMGSEAELLRRLGRAGYRAWFVPDARVAHYVRPEQLDEDWLVLRGYRHGRAASVRGLPPSFDHGPAIGGMPLALLVKLLANRALGGLLRFGPPSASRLRYRYRAAYLSGLLTAARRRARAGPKPLATLASE
jgi:glycosyltransferase involved in cell wall biosynthesis